MDGRDEHEADRNPDRLPAGARLLRAAPAETVPAAGEGAAADPWEIPADNPIDAAIPVPPGGRG